MRLKIGNFLLFIFGLSSFNCDEYNKNTTLITGTSIGSFVDGIEEPTRTRELRSCPEGWTEVFNQCFFFPTEKVLNFEEGSKKCNDIHKDLSSLAVIRSKEANDAVKKNIKTKSYIGLKRHEGTEQWSWVDGGLLDEKAFTSWAPEYPKSDSGLNVVEIDEGGLWKNVEGTGEENIICSMHKSTCPKGFVFFEEACYYFSEDLKTFKDAHSYCENVGVEGSFMGSVYGTRVNDFFAEKLKGEQAYLGLFKDVDGDWVWSDGSVISPNDFTNWKDGASETSGDCVGYDADKKWNYFPCETVMKFVCQVFPHESPTPNCNFNDGLNWLENPVTGMCFLIMNKRLLHSEAEDKCKEFSEASNPAHLASIHSPTEQHFLTNAYTHLGRRGSYWIGLLLEDSFLKWTDQSPLSYIGFESGINIQDCAKISLHEKKNKWVVDKCDSSAIPFLCSKKGKNYFPPSVLPSANDCPKDWLRIGGQCLHFSNIEEDYKGAQTSCGGKNGTLAFIEDAATNEFIRSEIHKLTGTTYYFGLNDIEVEGTFTWPDGSNLTDFISWADNYPSQGDKTKNCVGVGSDGLWKDFACTEKKKFVCSLAYDICPFHWHPMHQRCFYTSDEKLNFLDAQSKCKEIQSTLVSIHSEHESYYLTSQLSKKDDRFWLGLSKDKYEQEYLGWLDGTELDYSNFLDKKDVAQEENLFYGACLDVDGVWRTAKSNETFGFACSTNASHYMSCPHGWKKAFGSCYLLVEEKLTFQQASGSCEKQGGYLVRIEDESEQDYILSDLQNSDLKSIWIGLKNIRKTEKYFEWEDGSEIGYSNWDKLIPSPNSGQDCVVLNELEQRYWRNEKCSTVSAYMCETFQEITEFPPPSEKGCNPNQVPYQGSCFEMFLTKATYTESVDLCAEKEGKLLKIKDLANQARIISLIHNSGGEFFLGLQFNKTSSSWHWQDGSELNGFSNWGDDEPNTNLAKDLCAVMRSKGPHLGTWRTLNCEDKRNVICQFQRKGFTDPPETTTPLTTWDPSYKCPPNYQLIDAICYYFSGAVKMNFDAAEDYCSYFGGHLIGFRDRDHEQNVLKELVHGFPQNTYFGLREFPSIGGIHWMNPDISYGSYVNWGPNQPNSHGGSTPCGYLQFDEWMLGNCLNERSFICSAPPRTTPFSTAPPEPSTHLPYPPCDGEKGEEWFMLPIPSPHFCYKFSEETVSWQTALRRCRAEGSELVSLHKPTENNFLWRKLKEELNTNWLLWIGLSDLYEDGVYKWSDGSPLNYINWEEESGEDPESMDSCTQMLLGEEEGTWGRAHCGLHRGYVCKKPQGGSFPSPTPEPPFPKGHCPKGVPEFSGFCYPFTQQVLSWSEALAFCRSKGSDLLSVHSSKEMAFISSRVLPEMNSSVAWIGLKYLGKGHGYGWSDEQPVKYSNWAGNEPNSMQGNQECVYAYAQDIHKLGRWGIDWCNYKKNFICKHEADPTIANATYTLPECPLHSDFLELNGNCFLQVEEKKLWSEAEAYCQNKDSHLVSIQTMEENSFLTAYLNEDSWMGLSFSPSVKELTWTDGNPYIYEKFQLDEQIDPSVSNCVYINSKSGEWKFSKDCDKSMKKTFWCGIKKPVDEDANWVGKCPDADGWKQGPREHCFYFGKQGSFSYETAKDACLSVNGTLAGIHNRIDNKWLQTNAQDKTSGHWIGIQRVILETGVVEVDNFFWCDKEPYKGAYHNWVQGYHNNKGKYGVFFPLQGKWGLEDASQSNYICSTPKIFATQPSFLPTDSPDEDNISDSGIAGIVVGVLFFISITTVGVFILLKKGKLPSLRRNALPSRHSSGESTLTNINYRL